MVQSVENHQTDTSKETNGFRPSGNEKKFTSALATDLPCKLCLYLNVYGGL